MKSPLAAAANFWLRRAARPEAAALAAVAGLRPAVVITGASRGIGRALARRFAEASEDIVLIARDVDGLDKTAKALATPSATGRILTLPLDITLAEAPEAIDRFLADNGAYLDILVNNAGIGLGGRFEDSSPEAIDRLVALNVGATSRLMRHYIGSMKARGRGGILNIASLGGVAPGPYQAAYYASKAYIISLTVAVAAESSGSGVRITAVAPGPVDTDFHASMGAESALYRLLLPSMSADAVARSAYRAHMLGRRLVYPGILPPLMAVSLKILPHAITVPLVGWLLNAGPPKRPTPK
jgi:short-subunit dehydrogenase